MFFAEFGVFGLIGIPILVDSAGGSTLFGTGEILVGVIFTNASFFVEELGGTAWKVEPARRVGEITSAFAGLEVVGKATRSVGDAGASTREEVTDATKGGTRHFHKGNSEEEGKDLDGDTEDDADGVFGASHDHPASEARGAKEQTKHRIEDKHLHKKFVPFFEVFFGVGEEVGDKSKRRDHNEQGDDGLAKRNSKETDGDGYDTTDDDGDKKGEECGEPAGYADGDAENGATSGDGRKDIGDVDVDIGVDSPGSDGRFADISKKVANTDAKDVADVDCDGGDDKGKVDENSGDDDAGEGAFNAVVVDAKSGDLGIDDSE